MEGTKKVQPGQRQDSENISNTIIIPQQTQKNQTKSQEMPVMMRAALGYADRFKWAVFPVHSIQNGKCTCFKKNNCDSPGKHPRTQNGLKDATTDQNTIIEWWNKWPNANVAVATGQASGFFALDIDIKDDGPESLRDLIDSYSELPETVEAVTGSGGSHYLFKHESGINNVGRLVEGIDIRGDGGYIVVAPSNHISGNSYQWEVSSHPIDLEIAEAPDWLSAMVKKNNGNNDKKKYEKKPDSYWVKLLQGVGDGERNSSTASLVGYLLKKGISAEITLELILLWNERCDPPEDEEVVIRTFRSILEKEIRRRGGNRQ